ncbi:MAG: hypothetical protein HOV79_23075 [Hamadaea sp.]|nr:hypothetical protein [Hamadaea sp.]
MADQDPLAQLEEWGRGVERRVRRRQRLEAFGRASRRFLRASRRPAAALLALAVLGACGVFGLRFITTPRSPRPYATASAPDGVSATSGAGGTAASPFDGTPAAAFPAGRAGIVLPTAAAAGPWPAADVRTALDRVSAALVASHLDERVLVRHDTSAFVAMLAPDVRRWWTSKLQGPHYGVTVVRIAADARLAAVEPRVSGRTTYRASALAGRPALEVITNYVWVYAFDVPADWTGSRTVVVHGEEHWFFVRSGTTLRMYLEDTKGYWGSMDCDASRKALTAPWRGGPAEVVPSSTPDDEPQEAYYQPDHALEIAGSCADS